MYDYSVPKSNRVIYNRVWCYGVLLSLIFIYKEIVLSKLVCFVFSALNEKPIYAIINVVVKITNILPPETITNVLHQQMQVTKVLAYDDTNSININVYGELGNTIEKGNVYNMAFLQIHNYSLQRLLKTTDWTQLTISPTKIETPSSIIDTQTEVLNTKISKVDQNDLVIAYYCPSLAIPATPDHEGIIDGSCGLMATKDKCLTNDKLLVTVVNESVEISLQVNLSMLTSCYGINSDAKKFAKSLITTPVNVRYDNVYQTILLLEKYAD